MRSGQEISASPTIPRPLMRRFQSVSSAAPTSTFFGSQPRSAQVPPYGSSSTIATRHPALRQRDATAEPPVPVPITMRSKASAMIAARVTPPNALWYRKKDHCTRDGHQAQPLPPLRAERDDAETMQERREGD